MKRIALILLMVLLWGCGASVVEVEETIIKNEQPVLVLTYVEGLEASLERFLNRPFEVVRSLDDIDLLDYERVLVLYDDNLRRVFPPLIFGGPRLDYTNLVTFTLQDDVEITMVYLDNQDDYIEMFNVVDHRIFETREIKMVYEFYPLNGTTAYADFNQFDRELLRQNVPSNVEIAPRGGDFKWFYTSQEVYLFIGDKIPIFLSAYEDEVSALEEEVGIFQTERGQRLVIGRATGPFAGEFYVSFLNRLSAGIMTPMVLPPLPVANIQFPQPRTAPPEACYTRDLRAEIDVMMKDSTTVSHEIDKNRLPSTGTVRGLVVMIGFDEFPPVVTDEEYLSTIQKAKEFSIDYYDEMSAGQLAFEFIYYPEIVYVPFTFNPSITYLSPNYMDYIDEHVQTVIEYVERDFDLSEVDFLSFFWPFGIPYYMGDGVAQQLSERMNTQRGNITNYILQRVVHDRNRMAHVVTHEIAHNLGLTDIYIFTWSEVHWGKSDTYGFWDLMWGQNELKAWHRWILKWMPDEQVHCLPHGTNQEHTVFLQPLNHLEADTRQIVVSLSETEAISIELRGPGRYCVGGCDQNVLVTYINTLTSNGAGPMEILRPARSKNPQFRDSLLLQGEFVQFRNITITHEERYRLGSFISIRFD
jgi:M6 family metalloprotease-like protein